MPLAGPDLIVVVAGLLATVRGRGGGAVRNGAASVAAGACPAWVGRYPNGSASYPFDRGLWPCPAWPRRSSVPLAIVDHDAGTPVCGTDFAGSASDGRSSGPGPGSAATGGRPAPGAADRAFSSAAGAACRCSPPGAGAGNWRRGRRVLWRCLMADQIEVGLPPSAAPPR